MPLELRLSLFSNTPVVGCELNPKASIISNDLSTVPQHSLEFNWYKNDEKVTCCVHPLEPATIQCMCCISLKLPVKDSYYCTSECFLEDWKNHRVRHCSTSAIHSKSTVIDDQRSRELRSSGSWPSFDSLYSVGSDAEINTNPIKEEGGGNSWTKICSSRTYIPTMRDFGFKLKLESLAVDCNDGNPLVLKEIIVTDPVIIAPVPIIRRMIPVEPWVVKTRPRFVGAFSVLSYNVLAAYYVNENSYQYCPRWALTWEYRRQILLREIIQCSADILCLQEVQKDHFEDFFEPELAKLGYSVCYKTRLFEYYSGEYKSTIDGCATFFRRDRFKQIKKHELEFHRIADSVYNDLNPAQKKECVSLVKDNVAIIVILESMENEANTHIHANEKSKDAKLWQVATLVNELEKIADSHIPVLICGDLNSLPGSAPHDLLIMGKVNFNPNDFGDARTAMFKHVKLSHQMHLASAYSSLLKKTGGDFISNEEKNKMDLQTSEPLFTNYTKGFKGAIDYIFYSEDRIAVKRILDLLDDETAAKHTALPSPYWPSDHISLMAEFYMPEVWQ